MKHHYTEDSIKYLKDKYDITDCHTWPFYPIIMPIKHGLGPVDYYECEEVVWEVWDHLCAVYGRFNSEYKAINLAIALSEQLMKG